MAARHRDSVHPVRHHSAQRLDVVPGVPHVLRAFAAILGEGEAALTPAGGRDRAVQPGRLVLPGISAKTRRAETHCAYAGRRALRARVLPLPS